MPVTSGVWLAGQRRTGTAAAATAAVQNDIDPGPKEAGAVQVTWGWSTDRGRIRRTDETALSTDRRDNATAVMIDVPTVSGRASDDVTVRRPEPDGRQAEDRNRTLRPGESGAA